MSCIKSPQRKKALVYVRDRYVERESDKARSGWRIKKHKARRSLRHAVNTRVRTAGLDLGFDSVATARRQRRHERWPVPSLRERIARKLNRRIRSQGAKKARRRLKAIDGEE